MKVVYSSQYLFMVHHLKHILESNGIECWVKNEHLSGAAGELPPTECWPELCVEEHLASRAEALIAKNQQENSNNNKQWKCPCCAELIEPQFEWCWNCGCDMEDAKNDQNC